VALAAPGSAAPYVTAPALSVATTGPCQSTSLAVKGTGFVPGSTVTLTLRPPGSSLGSVVVDAAGEFTTTVMLPEVTGTFQLVAAGPPTPTNPNTAQATLDIRSCVSPVPTPSYSSAVPVPSRSGPVPITGYSGGGPAGGVGYALPAGVAAVACLLLGGGLAWRRRRSHAA
jgi:hypothetical protein